MQLRSILLSLTSLAFMTSVHASTHTHHVSWQSSSKDNYQAPSVSDSTAALVFVRSNQSLGMDSSTNIAINGRYLTSLHDGHYSGHSVCAGMVQISAVPTSHKINDLGANATIISLAPHQIQYIKVDVAPNFAPTLSPISEADARHLIAQGARQTHQISRVDNSNCTLLTRHAPPPRLFTPNTAKGNAVSYNPKSDLTP